MRIVIDLQGAQTESRFRGIGRYTMSLAQAMVRNRGDHEILIALNGLFPETIEPIRGAFDDILPQENIRVWNAPGPVRECHPANAWRREAAELVREAFLQSLRPDFVLVTSLFEGLGDDAVASIGRFDQTTPVAAILYDLIPLINPDIHFQTSKIHQDYYQRKIASLRRSRHLLAISASAAQEAITALPFSADHVTNISGAIEAYFQPALLSDQERLALWEKFKIQRPFVMYSGGADERKNLPRLIQAYSRLPEAVRRNFQLVFVGKMPPESVRGFQAIAKKAGLVNAELLFTGYVSDEELVRLYSTAHVFVFPSLHEGFGLPPLEAMACGAAVIGANATSLPEVIGWSEAMFDPSSVDSMTALLSRTLSDDGFRERLRQHGCMQYKKFSWDESARKALSAITLDVAAAPASLPEPGAYTFATGIFRKDCRKILLLKLDHMGDLILAIPAIMKLRAKYPYAQLDIVVGSWNEPLARSLNVFSNIFLFDYFKKKSAAAASFQSKELADLLVQLPDYDLVIDLRRQSDTRFLLEKIPARQKVGYQTGNVRIDSCLTIGLPAEPDRPFIATRLNETSIAVQMLNLIDALPSAIGDFIAFPVLAEPEPADGVAVALFPAAGNDVKEWGRENFAKLLELLCADARVDIINLYFSHAGEADSYGFWDHPKIQTHAGLPFAALTVSVAQNSICVANNSFGAHIASYLGVLTLAVYAGHETIVEWAPVFGDSFVIGNPVPCSPCHIAHRQECQFSFRCLKGITPSLVFTEIMESLAAIATGTTPSFANLVDVSAAQSKRTGWMNRLTEAIAALPQPGFTDADLKAMASCLADNFPEPNRPRQLLVDLSQLVHTDARSGIQRVTRAYLTALLQSPPEGFAVEPVYALVDSPGYYYARRFMRNFAGLPVDSVSDEPIQAYAGDVFLGLDLQPDVIPAQAAALSALQNKGVKIYFFVYDLLPVIMPEMFPRTVQTTFPGWLETVSKFDGAICDSRSTANDLQAWIAKHGGQRFRPYRIGWVQLGADIDQSAPTRGLPDNATHIMSRLRQGTTFLMVGTIEPRKGHAQAMAAFELLWQEGVPVNLVIVGKQGWNVEDFVRRIKKSSALDQQLFWLADISDEFLGHVYDAAHCLIAASLGEGFGLPLIEAAQHKLPIIARDIPVFREVAGEHAFYFSGLEPRDLSDRIREWMALSADSRHPRSDNLPWLTWRQSAEQLKQFIGSEHGWNIQIRAKENRP